MTESLRVQVRGGGEQRAGQEAVAGAWVEVRGRVRRSGRCRAAPSLAVMREGGGAGAGHLGKRHAADRAEGTRGILHRGECGGLGGGGEVAVGDGQAETGDSRCQLWRHGVEGTGGREGDVGVVALERVERAGEVAHRAREGADVIEAGREQRDARARQPP